MVWRVQNLPCHLVRRPNDDKAARQSAYPILRWLDTHVKDRYHAQWSGVPLRLVIRQGWIKRVIKLPDDRYCPFVTRKVSLLRPINDLLEEEEGDDDHEDGGGSGFAAITSKSKL